MNQEILELLAEKKYSAVKQLIGQMEEADLAKLFEELENEEDADQFNRLFRLLPKETAAEVFSYMEPEIQEKIVRTLTDTELQHILDDPLLPRSYFERLSAQCNNQSCPRRHTAVLLILSL